MKGLECEPSGSQRFVDTPQSAGCRIKHELIRDYKLEIRLNM